MDRDSYILLWELLILLLRQKSAIDGCDIAELLLKDRQDFKQPYMADYDSKYRDKNDSKKTKDTVCLTMSDLIQKFFITNSFVIQEK